MPQQTMHTMPQQNMRRRSLRAKKPSGHKYQNNQATNFHIKFHQRSVISADPLERSSVWEIYRDLSTIHHLTTYHHLPYNNYHLINCLWTALPTCRLAKYQAHRYTGIQVQYSTVPDSQPQPQPPLAVAVAGWGIWLPWD